MARSFLLLGLLGLLSTALPTFALGLPPASTDPQTVVFTEYPLLSQSVEVARRTLSPLANAEITRLSAKSPLRLQAIDLQHETFFVHVPANQPARGYGLLVFINPSRDAHIPPGWASVFDEHGLIYVSAYKSGNEESVIDRRVPLALLAAYNIIQHYPVDSDRVYVGGFSGGSRAALRVALAYPDLFRGALLNAGSDPIGDGSLVPPATDLFDRFQRSTRVIYVTGSEDQWNMQRDLLSQDSLRAYCVFGTRVETLYRNGHDIAAPNLVGRALTALDLRTPVDEDRLSACKARLAKALAADLQGVVTLIDRHKPRDAWRTLTEVDRRYGGLAAPDSIELEKRIGL